LGGGGGLKKEWSLRGVGEGADSAPSDAMQVLSRNAGEQVGDDEAEEVEIAAGDEPRLSVGDARHQLLRMHAVHIRERAVDDDVPPPLPEG
jgi:hypothetical protein